MCIANQNYVIEAVNRIIDLGLPDSLIPLAIVDHAKLMAGFDCESDIDPYDFWPPTADSCVTFQ